MNKTFATRWNASQLMSSKSYDINFYRDKDFQKVSMHSHDFYELYFFVQGSASYIIENGHYRLQHGDILLISPNNLHQLDIFDSSATYERIVLWLNPNYIKKLSTTKTNLAEAFFTYTESKNHLIRDKSLSMSIQTELLRLYECSENPQYGSDIEAETLIKNILLSLCKYSKIGEPSRLPEQNDTVTAAIEYINANLESKLSLEIIAEQLFVSKYYLAHLFKEETNTTPHKYILKKRLILSKKLIEEGLPICDLYAKCGFSDYTHFFRAFKAEYGITPKQYFYFVKNYH